MILAGNDNESMVILTECMVSIYDRRL